VRLPVGQSIQLGCAEASQDGKFSLGVLVVYLHHAADEELLLFSRTSLPVVGLGYGHGEALVTCPELPLRLLVILGIQVYVVLDSRQVFHGPRLADREGAICVLSSLVELDPAGVSDRYHDNASFLVRGGSGRRGRGLWERAIFLNADVGDVRLLD
jgi:hypothetical protein